MFDQRQGTPYLTGGPLELADLPDQAENPEQSGTFLKYATEEDKVVVVDPIRMRVANAIRDSVEA